MQAAKQDPYNAVTFLYLGYYYYQQTTDKTRARKCYQKAFDLDPQNDEAGQALCEILNANGAEVSQVYFFMFKTTKQQNLSHVQIESIYRRQIQCC